MVEAALVLAGFESVFDGPTMAFDSNKRVNTGSSRAPCREKGKITVTDVATDQQATGPQP